MASPTPGSGPPLGDDAQAAALTRSRRNATALLVVVAVAFLVAVQLPETTATGYLVAALEAGLVGGLADWFAVVALFRHPLGLPIPHTAVIPQSKDGLGRNLATFVEDNFLGGDQVRERVADPANVDRVAAALSDRARADRLVARAAGLLDATLESVDEDELVTRTAAVVRDRIREIPVSRLSGHALGEAIVDGRHDALVTAVFEGVLETIGRNRGALRQRLGEQSPSWVPPVVDDLVFERGEQVVRTFLQQLAADPEHEMRRALDEQLLAVTVRMRTDDAVRSTIDDSVQEVLTDELLQQWIRSWWQELRAKVAVASIDDGGHEIRATFVDPVVGLGRRLEHDEALRGRALELLRQAAEPVAEIGQREIGGLISSTVDRWDAQDTSRRLELWLGRDLQFVRINGTVVGALVGVVLHAITTFA